MPNIVLTQELKEKLKQAGSFAFDLENKWPYVPKAYREKAKGKYLIPKELWPVFTLRCLDGVASSLMEDKLYGTITIGEVDADKKTTKGTTMPLNSGFVRVETCRLGIITWKNYRDINGKTIPAPATDSDGNITEDSIRLINPRLQVELVNAITDQKILSEDELLGLDL